MQCIGYVRTERGPQDMNGKRDGYTNDSSRSPTRGWRWLEWLLVPPALALLYLVFGLMMVLLNFREGGDELCPRPYKPVVSLQSVALAPISFIVPAPVCERKPF